MNILELPPLPLEEEWVTPLIDAGAVRIERIVSTGQVSDWYDQPESEFVVLLSGHAVIEYSDGKTVALQKGDTLVIPPHERHRVAYTSDTPPCVWLCVFY